MAMVYEKYDAGNDDDEEEGEDGDDDEKDDDKSITGSGDSWAK